MYLITRCRSVVSTWDSLHSRNLLIRNLCSITDMPLAAKPAGLSIRPIAKSPNASSPAIPLFHQTNSTHPWARTYVDFVADHGFAAEQEAIKLSGLAPIGDCPVNEYDSERVLVCTQIPPEYTLGGEYIGQTAFLCDRRRSFQVRTGPGDPVIAAARGLRVPIPFHSQGHAKLMKLLATKGTQGQLLYLWGRRVGHCLELE